MQLEVGSVLEGKVTGITGFGAFVDLGEGKTGMVHISEVAPTFVQEIREHVQENQVVKVKVLSIGEDGKISLSIKRAMEQPRAPREGNRDGNREGNRDGGRSLRPRNPRPRTAPVVSPGRPGGYEWQPTRTESTNFEDMMSRFKQTSDEKMSDLKHSLDSKHGGFSRRGNRGGNGNGNDFR